MGTRAKAFRLSRPAVQKLLALAELYGSQVRALEVALDRLYQSEVGSGADVDKSPVIEEAKP